MSKCYDPTRKALAFSCEDAMRGCNKIKKNTINSFRLGLWFVWHKRPSTGLDDDGAKGPVEVFVAQGWKGHLECPIPSQPHDPTTASDPFEASSGPDPVRLSPFTIKKAASWSEDAASSSFPRLHSWAGPGMGCRSRLIRLRVTHSAPVDRGPGEDAAKILFFQWMMNGLNRTGVVKIRTKGVYFRHRLK